MKQIFPFAYFPAAYAMTHRRQNRLQRFPAKAAFVLLLILMTSPQAGAEWFTAPAAPAQAEHILPPDTSQLGEGLLSMLQKALPDGYIELRAGVKMGLAVFACAFLVALFQSMGNTSATVEIAGAACIAGILMKDSRSLVSLAVSTIREISEYSKLFFPVLTAAASARGNVTSAAALCVGTCGLTAFLNGVLSRVAIPGVYLYLVCAIAGCIMGGNGLKQLRDSIKKVAVWFLKTVLTLFLGYMSVTGVVTGAADKTTLKAAKAAISAVVPVIGKTLADASETLLLSAQIAKNSLGVYGIFVFFGILLSPFLRIGTHYLVLKAAATLCAITGSRRMTQLVEDFCTAMGLLLAMAAEMCALSVIGIMCFLKGAG